MGSSRSTVSAATASKHLAFRRPLATVLFVQILLYVLLAPVRGTGLGVIPNAVLISLAPIAILVVVSNLTIEASRQSLAALVVASTLFFVHLVLNPFHEHSAWTTLEVVDGLGFPLLLFSIPIVAVGSRHRLRQILHLHAFTVVLVTIGILLVGLGIYDATYVRLIGNRVSQLRFLFMANTFPLHSTSLYSIYVIPAIPILLASSHYRSRWGSILTKLAVVFLLTGVFLVQSRKIYIAIPASLVVYYGFSPDVRRYYKYILPLSTPLLLVVGLMLYRSGFAVSSFMIRLSQYVSSVPFIIKHPFGAGHRSFEALTEHLQVHNVFLHSATDYGVIAAVLLVALFVIVIKRCVQTGAYSPDRFLWASCAGVVGIMVALSFDPHYEWQRMWLLFGVFLAYTDASVLGGEAASAARSG